MRNLYAYPQEEVSAQYKNDDEIIVEDNLHCYHALTPFRMTDVETHF